MMDYTELVKSLRHCRGESFLTCRECQYNNSMGSCAYKMLRDAADAIEALQAKLPKRGEWVGVSPMVDTVQCSVCGGQLFSAELETPYCPYCGAKMIGEQNVE